MSDDNKVANRDKKRFGYYFKWFLVLVVLYVAMSGPVAALESKGRINPTISPYCHKLYYPLDFLGGKHATIRKGFDWYNGLWAGSPAAEPVPEKKK